MKEFPEHALARIRPRATLLPVPGVLAEDLRSRRIKQEHLERDGKEAGRLYQGHPSDSQPRPSQAKRMTLLRPLAG